MTELPLLARATAHGDSVALRTSTAEYTYQELRDRSVQVAQALLSSAFAHADDLGEARVALLAPAGAEYIVGQWGTWQAGGIVIPLCLSATEPEWEYALTDSGAAIVIATAALAEQISSLCSKLNVKLLTLDETRGADNAMTTSLTLPDISNERRAMIVYTSGTTSKPKGVVTTHANIQAQITSLVTAWEWHPSDRIPLFLPLHHVHGIINVLACALWSGAIVEPFARFDVPAIFDRVKNGAYTLFMAVPTIYVKLIEALKAAAEPERKAVIAGFQRMRLMVSGSAALPASVHEQWFQLTNQKLLERYGMTEIGMALSNPYRGERIPGSVGEPLPGIDVRLKSESGEIISQPCQPGEIQVRGPGVFREYWNRPEITAASFDDGWFRTGDVAVRGIAPQPAAQRSTELDAELNVSASNVARVHDPHAIESDSLERYPTYYRILGRQSVDIIKSGGYKLSALEIEAVLLDHPAIRECAVVGIEDQTWGEVVAAAVALHGGATLDLDTLRAWCRDRLAPYKIPQRLLVVASLPRNAMGKVTKPAVQELFRHLSDTQWTRRS